MSKDMTYKECSNKGIWANFPQSFTLWKLDLASLNYILFLYKNTKLLLALYEIVYFNFTFIGITWLFY